MGRGGGAAAHPPALGVQEGSGWLSHRAGPSTAGGLRGQQRERQKEPGRQCRGRCRGDRREARGGSEVSGGVPAVGRLEGDLPHPGGHVPLADGDVGRALQRFVSYLTDVRSFWQLRKCRFFLRLVEELGMKVI